MDIHDIIKKYIRNCDKYSITSDYDINGIPVTIVYTEYELPEVAKEGIRSEVWAPYRIEFIYEYKKEENMSIKIEDLRIGQKVWYDGHEGIINYMASNVTGRIGINTLGSIITIDDPCLSLTPPKQKKRYWQWKIKGKNGLWFRPRQYLDNTGSATNGEIDYTAGHILLSKWKDIEKIKIEDDYVDVEE